MRTGVPQWCIWLATCLAAGCDCGGPIAATTPSLELSPRSVDFGVVEVGSSAQRQVLLRSVGRAPVEVIALRLETSPAVSLEADAGLVLPPGMTTVVQLVWSPEAGGSLGGALVVESTSLEERLAVLPLLGTARPCTRCPIVDGGHDAGEEPLLDGGRDAGAGSPDASVTDAGGLDAGTDAGGLDAGTDAGPPRVLESCSAGVVRTSLQAGPFAHGASDGTSIAVTDVVSGRLRVGLLTPAGTWLVPMSSLDAGAVSGRVTAAPSGFALAVNDSMGTFLLRLDGGVQPLGAPVRLGPSGLAAAVAFDAQRSLLGVTVGLRGSQSLQVVTPGAVSPSSIPLPGDFFDPILGRGLIAVDGGWVTASTDGINLMLHRLADWTRRTPAGVGLEPDVVWTGAEYGVVYSVASPTQPVTTSFFLARFSAEGVPQGPPLLLDADTRGWVSRGPAVAWDGRDYVAFFVGGPTGQLRVVRVASGALLPGYPVEVTCAPEPFSSVRAVVGAPVPTVTVDYGLQPSGSVLVQLR